MNVYINPIPVSSSRWHSKKELPPVDFQHVEAAFARFRGAREVPNRRFRGELEKGKPLKPTKHGFEVRNMGISWDFKDKKHGEIDETWRFDDILTVRRGGD